MSMILNLWMASLQLLNREQALLWMRGSLNMAWRGCKTLAIYWGVGALALFLCMYIIAAFFVPDEISLHNLIIMPTRMSLYTMLWVNYFILMSVVLAIRPSVQRKDSSYFISYGYSKRLIEAIIPAIFLILVATNFLNGFLLLFFGAASFIFLSLFLLFYFDGDVGIKHLFFSIKRATSMLLYTTPLLLLLSFLYIPFFGVVQLLQAGNYLGDRIMLYQALLLVVSVFIIPFLVAPLVFLYVKSVNQTYELYYE